MVREHYLKHSRVQQWIDTFIPFGTKGLTVSPKSMEAIYQNELKGHREKIGELMLEIDALKKAEAILSKEEASRAE